ncbi:MAG: Holliday junction branch migration protein RuvA [Ignavibacteriales bacterium]|nr:Holliday junction branch migration protein RuvA [Ignavibacteriales bacterium]MBK7980806.1 Holliday junction branch migration protein RuvA [Ignavibacteriota bacterium]
MIGYLTGKIISKKPTQILLDVNDVGFLVNISLNTFEKISETEGKISLYTYLSVKEDSLTLFGFYSISEKELFEALISMNGIGPKLAQNILSGISVEELKSAILTKNLARLVSIPGIGRKTAERMLIELREKMEKVSDQSYEKGGLSFTTKDDAVAALTGLGYNQKIADKIVRDLISQNPQISLEDLIKDSLKGLSK